MINRDDLVEFLSESNLIEGVMDDASLKQALKAWDYLFKFNELNITNVLRTHAILMKGKLAFNEVGAWRKEEVLISGRLGKPWYAVPELMHNWIADCGKSKDEEVIKKRHILFEKIHPFIDGNGRMGRILWNWERVKMGLPLLIIYEESKSEYYKMFA